MNYHPRHLRKKRESWKYFFSYERNVRAYTLLFTFGGMCILFSKPLFEMFVIPNMSKEKIEKCRNNIEDYQSRWKH